MNKKNMPELASKIFRLLLRPGFWLALCPLVCVFILCIPLQSGAQERPAPRVREQTYAPAGVLNCLNCHNVAPANTVLQTPHASRADSLAPFNDHDCETCHGPGSEHRRANRLPMSIQFDGGQSSWPVSSVEVQNDMCLGCHEQDARTHWMGSEHQFAGLACADCHDLHAARDPVLSTTTQAAVCTGCHQEKRAQFSMRSHHPVNEGLLSCSDCHNPHGSATDTLLAFESVSDTCTNCHAEKRGPFLWEHEPVTDGCNNCHDPHGSVIDRLLLQRPPFLCQNCHQDAFHPSSLYSGDDAPPLGAAQQLLGQACLNCHAMVHGSNHPSGTRLTR